jgi:hypothetical protein
LRHDFAPPIQCTFKPADLLHFHAAAGTARYTSSKMPSSFALSSRGPNDTEMAVEELPDAAQRPIRGILRLAERRTDHLTRQFRIS